MTASNSQKSAKEKVKNTKDELKMMETELDERYRDIGKILLERIETEGRNIDSLVDRIIETRIKLAASTEEDEDETR